MTDLLRAGERPRMRGDRRGGLGIPPRLQHDQRLAGCPKRPSALHERRRIAEALQEHAHGEGRFVAGEVPEVVAGGGAGLVPEDTSAEKPTRGPMFTIASITDPLWETTATRPEQAR